LRRCDLLVSFFPHWRARPLLWKCVCKWFTAARHLLIH
jgi:hypothetical protein